MFSRDNPNSLIARPFFGATCLFISLMIITILFLIACELIGYGIVRSECRPLNKNSWIVDCNSTDIMKCYGSIIAVDGCFFVGFCTIVVVILCPFAIGLLIYICVAYGVPQIKTEVRDALVSADNMTTYGTFIVVDDPKEGK